MDPITTEIVRRGPGWLAPIGRAVGWTAKRIRRLRASRRVENRIRVCFQEIAIHSADIDVGTLDLYGEIANFSRKHVLFDRVEVRGWSLGSRQMRAQTSLLRATGDAKRLSHGNVTFSLALDASDIRNIGHGVVAAPNARSTPTTHFHMSGTLLGRAGRHPLRVEFEVTRHHIGVHVPGT